jgi:hypothetical protein
VTEVEFQEEGVCAPHKELKHDVIQMKMEEILSAND